MKYEANNPKGFSALEIIEVLTQACYKENQIVYICRLLCVEKQYDGNYTVAHNMAETAGANPYHKYREDELVTLPEDKKYILINKCDPERDPEITSV
jgi:hypothetical protein